MSVGPLARLTHHRTNAQAKPGGFKFKRNSANFPTLFWAETATVNEIVLMAAAALVRALKVCDHGRTPHLSASVLTVIYFWGWSLVQYGGRDPLTALPLDFSMQPDGVLVPTLIAHRMHGEVFDFGWTTPFPRDSSDFDANRLNVRVELRSVNFWLSSMRYPTILSILNGFGEYQYFAQRADW